MNKKTLRITVGAAIAALYVVLTFVANAAGLANGAFQVRISEALTILPYFTPVAIPGLFVGCLLSNILTGCLPLDIVFGSLATLIGAIGTHILKTKLPKKLFFLGTLPPILANTVIVPFVLIYAYGLTDAWWYLALTVGVGEIISCGILGCILYKVLEKNRNFIEI